MKDSNEYLEFLKKFETKKTTDDCYTPPAVYDVVLDYVKENCNIEGLTVLRPFYPNGDYKKEDYTNSVVIDNPPFSILAEIIRFYNENNIKYFLFAPFLTCLNSKEEHTVIITYEDIIYENGARIKTSFVSNLFGELKVIGDPKLGKKIKNQQKLKKIFKKPRYNYPYNVLTSTRVGYLVQQGKKIVIHKKETSYCRQLDEQKQIKKEIFGAGLLVSDRVAKIIKTACNENKNIISFNLSEREKEIIKELNNNI